MIFNLAFWLSVGIAASGALGLWLAGKGMWQGWAVGLIGQPIWFVFGLVTHGYGLCVTCAMYGTVYTRNLVRARRTSVLGTWREPVALEEAP